MKPNDAAARARQGLNLFTEPREGILYGQQLDQIGDTLLMVQHVVQRLRQPKDVVAIDREHERGVERRDDAVGELVPRMFELPKTRGVLFRVPEIVHQGEELTRAVGDVPSRLVEQVVEDQLARYHLERHPSGPSWGRCGADRTGRARTCPPGDRR